jgi:hypothetical protein
VAYGGGTGCHEVRRAGHPPTGTTPWRREPRECYRLWEEGARRAEEGGRERPGGELLSGASVTSPAGEDGGRGRPPGMEMGVGRGSAGDRKGGGRGLQCLCGPLSAYTGEGEEGRRQLPGSGRGATPVVRAYFEVLLLLPPEQRRRRD